MSQSNFIISQKQSLVLKSCPHGLVHLSLGPLTVRIETQTFCEMAKDIWHFSQGLQLLNPEIPPEKETSVGARESKVDPLEAKVTNKILKMPLFGKKGLCPMG